MRYAKPRIIAIVEPTEPALQTSSVRDWRVRRLTDKISQCRGDARLKLTELSRQIGLTASHIGRRFRQQLGVGFRAFSVVKRDEFVCELLRATDLSVKEIAARAGYKQVADLNHSFRRRHDVSPTGYRSQFRLGQSLWQ